MSPPSARMDFTLIKINNSAVLAFGGIAKTKGGEKKLTDLWQLNTDMVKDDLPKQNLAKKKELTGSIWS